MATNIAPSSPSTLATMSPKHSHHGSKHFRKPSTYRPDSMVLPRLARSRPTTLHNLHDTIISRVSLYHSTSLREELLEHSRYIRDYLASILRAQASIPVAEIELLRSVLTRVATIPMSIELLRFSRIEKALVTIAYTSAECWPAESESTAQRILKRWEVELGQEITNVQQDFFGRGGRLEGIRAFELSRGERDIQDADRAHWAARPIDTLRPVEQGHTGFHVGEWFLSPSTAHLAGIIGNPTLPLSTTYPETHDPTSLATALLLLTPNTEELLPPHHDGTFLKYHHPTSSPQRPISLCRLLASDTNRQLRLLRSHRLNSPLAPSAGVRYDGLYSVRSYSVKLAPPNDWFFSFVLERVCEGQPPLSAVRGVPKSDQLEDWRDYRALLLERFGPAALGEGGERGRGGSVDSGYSSSVVNTFGSGGRTEDRKSGNGEASMKERSLHEGKGRWGGVKKGRGGDDDDELVDLVESGEEVKLEKRIEPKSDGKISVVVKEEIKSERAELRNDVKGTVVVSEILAGGEMAKGWKEMERERYLSLKKKIGL